ncbi:hypothetical protein EVAR_10360_1 [Eumeta japonica]|uniref:Uncharacterized protein n=1 Tax=Eumeta variegata TaxID=151549 RepID=A0A4C1UDD4_EUMVA|nr:hypothetical protein EVAR_10360_1 [Eumeta japonica]
MSGALKLPTDAIPATSNDAQSCSEWEEYAVCRGGSWTPELSLTGHNEIVKAATLRPYSVSLVSRTFGSAPCPVAELMIIDVGPTKTPRLPLKFSFNEKSLFQQISFIDFLQLQESGGGHGFRMRKSGTPPRAERRMKPPLGPHLEEIKPSVSVLVPDDVRSLLRASR